jgi:hypothetical protein
MRVTDEEKRTIYAALSAPFPEEAIERTDGRTTGRGYSTTGIKAQFIIDRLNQVIGLGNWRLHREISVREGSTASGRKVFEAIADVVLELGTWNEDGKFVPWAEALADGGHTSLSEADAKKGSASNGLKKAAAMFGCGREAYAGTIDDDNTPAADPHQEHRSSQSQMAPASQSRPESRSSPEHVRAATHAVGDSVQQPRSSATRAPEATQNQQPAKPVQAQPNRSRLTSKQLAALWAMARKMNLDHGTCQ